MPAPADLSLSGNAPDPIPTPIKVAFASGPSHLNQRIVAKAAALRPELPLCVVAEFEPEHGTWIPYHVYRSYSENLAAIRAALGARPVAFAVMAMAAGVPLENMRRIARSIAGAALTIWDEDLRETGIAAWKLRQFARGLASPRMRRLMRRAMHPADAEIPVRARLAQAYGSMMPRPPASAVSSNATPVSHVGTTVVIPSRDGRELLESMLPALAPQLGRGEIVVIDNGSSDGTAEWLAANYPDTVRVIRDGTPLSFARAVNLGIDAAAFDRILLLNNDMIVAPGLVGALHDAFARVPGLFCATAQIFFPPGVRREETGKAVWRREHPLDFPVRCDDPLPGEDLTWVLYGSGGCSLFDTTKLRALGGVSEVYDPAYVEDLDFGFRAWKHGWPSVFCAAAHVEHRHRATTSRFFTPRQLDAFVEINYLRFLVHAVGDTKLFRKLWSEAIRRLQLTAMNGSAGALDALRAIPRLGAWPSAASGALSESEILALGNGDLAVFPGIAREPKPAFVIASPYLTFPLSHGGAVRMFNLMKHAARDYDLILIAFANELATPARELLEICGAVILVRRHGSHYRIETSRPDTVEEFDSECFRAALKQTVQRWRPYAVQLEFTQMAQYAAACAPAKTLLVEHDITIDLQEQLFAADTSNWEVASQLPKWRAFETAAWAQVDCVVTMSAKDKAAVTGAQAVECLPNGVDTERFRPSAAEPEPRRVLFIGSFAHLPNVLAMEFFLREVWPLLNPNQAGGYRLHVIAGAGAQRPEWLDRPEIEFEGFVADVRPAYERAMVVVAPLTASAGTNIKVLEAMSMGRAIVSTPAGVNGLDLSPRHVSPVQDIAVTAQPGEFATWIRRLCEDAGLRHAMERAARETALRWDWSGIAQAQSVIYERLRANAGR